MRSVRTRTGLVRSCQAVVESIEPRLLLSAGQLDGSFGAGGIAELQVPGPDVAIGYAAVDLGGSGTLVAGQSNGTFAVVKFDAGGNIVTSFGSNGVLTFPGLQGNASAIILDGNDAVIAGSVVVGGEHDMAIARFQISDGLGVSTSVSGISGDDNALGLRVDSGGDVVVAGYVSDGTSSTPAVEMFSTSGTTLTTADLAGAGVADRINVFACTFDGNGNALFAGSAMNTSTSALRVFLARTNDTGTLDNSFGSGGVVQTALGGDSEATAVQVDAADNVVIAGNQTGDVVVARFSGADGALDTGFGASNQGYVVTSTGQASSAAALAVDGTGIVVAGNFRIGTGQNTDYLLVRYTSAGALDSGFGTNGIATFDAGSKADQSHAVLLDGSGNIRVAGKRNGAPGQTLLTLLSVDSSGARTGLSAYTGSSPLSAEALDTALRPDGGIVQLAWVTGNDLAVIATTPEGQLDTSFGEDGIFRFPNTLDALDHNGGMAVDSSGGIVVAGQHTSPGGFAFKLDASGALESTFGVGGVAELPGDGNLTVDSVGRIAVTSDGTIAIAATGSDGTLDYAGVVLLTPEGDSATYGWHDAEPVAYDTEGTQISVSTTTGMAIAVADNGDLLIGGLATSTTGDSFGLITRFTATGSAASGFTTVYLAAGDPFSNSIGALATIGNQIFAAGIGSGDTLNDNAMIAQFDQDGSLVTLQQIVPPNSGYSLFTGLTADGQNLLASGTLIDGLGNINLFVARFEQNLTLDPNFGDGGFAPDTIVTTNAFSGNIIIQPSGRIVVGTGYAGTGMALVGLEGMAPVPQNHDPVADAGGSYGGPEGTAITLDGSGSSDPDAGDTLSYSWSIVDASNTEVDSGTGVTFDFTPADDGIYTAILTVTDGNGGIGTDTATITVSNVAPIAIVSGPSAGNMGQQLDYSVQIVDPGTADTETVDWLVLDDSNAFVAGASNGGNTFSFTPAAAGTYTLITTVTDDDGGADTVSQTISVASVPVSVINGQLVVNAQNGSANTVVISTDATGQTTVVINGVTAGLVTGFNSVIVHGGDQNDLIAIALTVTVPAQVYGGAGDDLLVGGGADSMLFGEDGNDILVGRIGSTILVGGSGQDLLIGGNGRNILIGGLGSDMLIGGPQDDILVAGNTAYDDSPTALQAILNEWNSPKTYLQRVNDLINTNPLGSRLNGNYFFTPDITVFEDNATDILLGRSGTDWFLFNSDSGVRDWTLDHTSREVSSDVDIVETLP